MNVDSHPLAAWARDLVFAYAGGLVLGAPVAVAGVWLTGTERAATVCLLVAMGVLFVALRRRPLDTSNTPTRGGQDRLVAPSVTSRRVA